VEIAEVPLTRDKGLDETLESKEKKKFLALLRDLDELRKITKTPANIC
jgi:hypothetical protein